MQGVSGMCLKCVGCAWCMRGVYGVCISVRGMWDVYEVCVWGVGGVSVCCMLVASYHGDDALFMLCIL